MVHRLISEKITSTISTAWYLTTKSGGIWEFVHIRVEDLLVEGDPPQIHLTHAKRGADRYVPILPALADELRTHLQGRQRGFLFESNRQTRYAPRTVQAIVTACARTAGITKR